MIPSLQEIVYRLVGALTLARFDARGAQYFDETPSTALRSFFAAAISLPAYIIILLLSNSDTLSNDLPSDLQPTDPTVTLLVHLLQYSLSWTVYPVIAYRICQSIGREAAFFRYLSAENWLNVVGYHLMLLVVIVIASGVLPESLGWLLLLSVYAYLLTYSWFNARTCLGIGSPGAAGLVVVQIFVTLAIEVAAAGVRYTPAG